MGECCVNVLWRRVNAAGEAMFETPERVVVQHTSRHIGESLYFSSLVERTWCLRTCWGGSSDGSVQATERKTELGHGKP